MLEDDAVSADGCRDCLPGVSGRVLERDVIGLEAVAVDLDRFGEKRSAGGLRVL